MGKAFLEAKRTDDRAWNLANKIVDRQNLGNRTYFAQNHTPLKSSPVLHLHWSPKARLKTIPLNKIKTIQRRIELRNLKQSFDDKDEHPIRVVHDGEHYHIQDDNHRVMRERLRGNTHIKAYVHNGWYSKSSLMESLSASPKALSEASRKYLYHGTSEANAARIIKSNRLYADGVGIAWVTPNRRVAQFYASGSHGSKGRILKFDRKVIKNHPDVAFLDTEDGAWLHPKRNSIRDISKALVGVLKDKPRRSPEYKAIKAELKTHQKELKTIPQSTKQYMKGSKSDQKAWDKKRRFHQKHIDRLSQKLADQFFMESNLSKTYMEAYHTSFKAPEWNKRQKGIPVHIMKNPSKAAQRAILAVEAAIAKTIADNDQRGIPSAWIEGAEIVHRLRGKVVKRKVLSLQEMPSMIGYSRTGIDDDHKFDRDDTTILGSFKGHDIHYLTSTFRGTHVAHDIWAVDQKTGKVNMRLSGGRGDDNKHIRINSVKGRKGSPIKAHELYHHLITTHSFTLTSDKNQSKGGSSTWKELSKNKDIHMTHDNPHGERVKLHPASKWHHNYSDETENSRFTAKKKT